VSSSSAGTVATLPELERVAGHVNAALRGALLVQHLATPGAAEPEEAAGAADRAGEVAQAAGHALALLNGLGARPAAVPAPAEPIPLHLLDTPDARQLLDLLRRAVAVAERLDLARGRALPPTVELLPAETRGLDFAEALADLFLRLEMEIHGPADLRQNGPRRSGGRE